MKKQLIKIEITRSVFEYISKREARESKQFSSVLCRKRTRLLTFLGWDVD
jgi:hypothetical protein